MFKINLNDSTLHLFKRKRNLFNLNLTEMCQKNFFSYRIENKVTLLKRNIKVVAELKCEHTYQNH